MTPLQKRVLDHVRDHYAEHGRSPTQRSIRRELGLCSAGKVNSVLQALAGYGFLQRTTESSGNYVPVGEEALKLSRIPTPELLAELQRREVDRINGAAR